MKKLAIFVLVFCLSACSGVVQLREINPQVRAMMYDHIVHTTHDPNY